MTVMYIYKFILLNNERELMSNRSSLYLFSFHQGMTTGQRSLSCQNSMLPIHALPSAVLERAEKMENKRMKSTGTRDNSTASERFQGMSMITDSCSILNPISLRGRAIIMRTVSPRSTSLMEISLR